jgi:hypothetical protein
MTHSAFDGTAAGPATPVALNDLTSSQLPVSRTTGMFFWNGRLYYTLSGGDTFVASGVGDGRDWSGVNGMTMASGRLLYGSSTGTLSTVDFSGGLPTGPRHRGERPRHRRPVLAVPRPVRPQPGQLTFRYPAPHQPL